MYRKTCCVEGLPAALEVPGSIAGWKTQNFPWTLISKIPAGYCSDETLNLQSLVPVSMLDRGVYWLVVNGFIIKSMSPSISSVHIYPPCILLLLKNPEIHIFRA